MFEKERFEQVDEWAEAPLQEPERQYYYMKKCRHWAKQEEGRLGRPLTMSIQTLGCQMNAKDSEKMTAILSYIGYEETEEPVADLVLFNTCTVRENANMKIYGRLGYLKNHKKKNPHMKIVLCGCMMQEADEVERVRKSYPFCRHCFRNPQHLQTGRTFVYSDPVRGPGYGCMGGSKRDYRRSPGKKKIFL